MKKTKKEKKVSFVVGATLDGPTVVTHVISEETVESAPKQVLQKVPSTSTKCGSLAKGKNKRTCGQSQRDARMKLHERQNKHKG